MNRKSMVYIISIILGIVIVGGLTVKGDTKTIEGYINGDIAEIEIEKQNELERKGIKVISNDKSLIQEIQILNQEYALNSIQIGDTKEKIYQVYLKDEIHEYENHIYIEKGQETHYGVVTEYIKYIIGTDGVIQETRKGYTTPFTNVPLPESNQAAKLLLEGEWVSDQGRILDFQEDTVEDSYLDALWNKQKYIILSPNEMMIIREKEEVVEKVKIKFWLDSDKLYIFAIDEDGIPIEQSIEMFMKERN